MNDLDFFDFTVLQHAQHLNGVINETLRLHPAAPTGNLRETPPKGAMISGEYCDLRAEVHYWKQSAHANRYERA